MAVKTHIDELINFSSEILLRIAESPEVVGLIMDVAPADVTDEEKDAVWRYLYDYDWIDETVQSAGSFVLVDVDMVAAQTGTIKDLEIYVQVVVSKQIMALNHKTFKGVRGNRRDNLARQIDLLLNGSRDFGIGQLQLASVRTANVPAAFTSKLLTYRISNFAKNREAQ